MKKIAVLLLTALLALAAGAATAEKEKPAALPSAEGAWPELESVRALLDDDIQRIEIATYTRAARGGSSLRTAPPSPRFTRSAARCRSARRRTSAWPTMG